MTDNMEIWNKLAAEFPREQISWRAQNITQEGDKAMALAYIDARDVMDRLDTVCGPANWQDRYEFSGNTAICYLSILPGRDELWVTKADGAGSTDVEAEKGQISDAFKRAAVRFGIGRYLYAMPTIWVPCDSYKNKQDKLVWKKWKADPWDYVKTAPKAATGLAGGRSAELATEVAQEHWKVIVSDLNQRTTIQQLNGAFERHRPVYDLLPDHFQAETQREYYELREKLGQPNPPKAAKPDPKVANFDNLQPNDIDVPHATRVAQTP